MVNPDTIKTVFDPHVVNTFKYIKMGVDTAFYGAVWLGGVYLGYQFISNGLKGTYSYFKNRYSAEAIAANSVAGKLEDKVDKLEKQINILNSKVNSDKFPVQK